MEVLSVNEARTRKRVSEPDLDQTNMHKADGTFAGLAFGQLSRISHFGTVSKTPNSALPPMLEKRRSKSWNTQARVSRNCVPWTARRIQKLSRIFDRSRTI